MEYFLSVSLITEKLISTTTFYLRALGSALKALHARKLCARVSVWTRRTYARARNSFRRLSESRVQHSSPGTVYKKESEIPYLAYHTGLMKCLPSWCWQQSLWQIGVCGVGTLSRETQGRGGGRPQGGWGPAWHSSPPRKWRGQTPTRGEVGRESSSRSEAEC